MHSTAFQVLFMTFAISTYVNGHGLNSNTCHEMPKKDEGS